jgi:hypothetical protein
MTDDRDTRYVLLKFVPDRLRFEPINVGVVIQDRGQVITLMATAVDPRVRFADPYADVESLRSFLEGFDARSFVGQTSGRPLVDWLHDQELPNIYVTAPLPIDASGVPIMAVAERLFARLVDRDFARPTMMEPGISRTAARRALMSAFQAEGVLGSKVISAVQIKGASGIEWTVDFRFATDTVNLVQAATTTLREDVRRKEHAFEAFASLIDTRQAGTTAVLASDALPQENDVSSQINQMADAHGIRFIGGRRAFLKLAREVRDEGLLLSEPPEASLFPLR